MLSTLACLILTHGVGQATQFTETRCLDTWLDRSHPETNYGRDSALVLGTDADAVVRFPLIDQTVSGGFKVTDAKVVFHIIDKSVPKRLVVSELRQDWGEGGSNGNESDVSGKAVPASNGWATYHSARKGMENWTRPLGGIEDPIQGVTTTVDGNVLTVTGLGPLVQSWIDDPTRNHGLLLSSPDNLILASSETQFGPQLLVSGERTAPPGGPDLAIVSAEPSAGGWEIKVENFGTRPSGAVTVEWSAGSQTGTVAANNLEPGQGSSVNATTPKGAVSFRASCTGDIDTSNNFLFTDSNAVAVKLGADSREQAQWQRTIREMNEWVLPRSRSHAFLDGSAVRLRTSA